MPAIDAKYVVLSVILWLSCALWAQNADQKIDSLKTLIDQQPPGELVKTLNRLSTELRVNDLDASFRYATQARELAALLRDEDALAEAFQNLGSWYLQKRINDSAIRYFRRSLLLVQETRQDPVAARALSGLGEAYCYKGMYDSAWAAYGESLQKATALKMTGLQAAITNGMGVVAADQGLQDSAIALYFRAYSLYRSMGQTFNSAIIMNNVATLAIDLKHYDQALQYLDTALLLQTAVGYARGIASVYNNRSICYRHLGLPEEAIRNLRQALEVSQREGFRDAQATSAHMLGNLMLDQGRMPEARHWLMRSMEICDSIGLDYGVLVNEMALAYYHLATDQPDSAMECSHRAATMARWRNWNKELAEVSEILYKAHKAIGNADSALLYHEQMKVLNDSLFNTDQAARIATLEARYEQQRNLTRIARLDEENATLEMRIRSIIAGIVILILIFALYLSYRRYQHRTLALRAEMVETRKEQLMKEVEYQDKELMVNAMHLARLNDITYQVATRLKQLQLHMSAQNAGVINTLVHDLETGATTMAWDEFETRFRKIHQEFYDMLLKNYPDLTPMEVKICSFIRLNLTTKDIATLTNRSIRTVENTRNRIRHKMRLHADDNLTSVLMGL